MANIIGIDFGNWMTYVCAVFGMDPQTRMGGVIEDLIPSRYMNQGSAGIPNEYFWNVTTKDGQPTSNVLMGFQAARDTNRPIENHLRLIKQNLGRSIELYGGPNKTHKQTLQYNNMVTELFQYHVQLANEALRVNHGDSACTNLISITFPAKLRDPRALKYYIDLIEQSDSGVLGKNGKMLKLKVVGAVCEPAAACLDRLHEVKDTAQTDTLAITTLDFGGGTADIATVVLYPQGRKTASNQIYFYDVVCEGKGVDIAGSVYSNRLSGVMVESATAELGHPPTESQMRVIARNVERCKIELSNDTQTDFYLSINDDEGVTVTVTREEFEAAIKPDVDRLMHYVQEYFDEHQAHRPDEVILTGGSSWIPYIRRRVEETLPEYRGRIHLHRPSKAAAYGAARFHAMDRVLLEAESTTTANANPTTANTRNATQASAPVPTSVVRKFVEHDIVTKIKADNDLGYAMETLIRKGTQIPCDSGAIGFVTGSKFDRTDYDVFVATKANPDPNRGDTDYRLLQAAELRYGRTVPKGTATTCRLTITELGTARLDAWMNDDTSIEIHSDFDVNSLTGDFN